MERVRSTGGVKKLIGHISISPVLLDSDFVVKRKVDSVLADYPQVEAQVKNGVVGLNGSIQKQNEEKLLKDVHQLPVIGIENGLAVKWFKQKNSSICSTHLSLIIFTRHN